MLKRDFPLQFKNTDCATQLVRYHRGVQGKNRFVVKNPIPREPNPLGLPPSFKRVYKPFDLSAKRTLVLSDVHLPYHDIAALTAAIEVGVEAKVDCVLVNGDLLDCHTLSRFERDPEARDFAQELEASFEFWDVLRKTFPAARLVYKLGNHDERYQRFVTAKAPELYGVEALRFDRLLRLDTWRVEMVEDKRVIRMGRLNVLHGHEYKTGFVAPVNTARGLFLRAKACALQGHNHQTSEHSEKTLEDKLIATWSTGCLCDLAPRYMPYNGWNHGAAIVTQSGDGFHVRNFRIRDGRVL
jgi:predicted phosphodiesterase